MDIVERSASPEQVAVQTRTLAVTDRLRRAILTGELAPGSHLRQVEVAERYGVSTTPIREAFATLAQEGLVIRDTHRGVVVFAPSVSEIAELYEIRAELEPLAARLAAPRLAPMHLDAAQLLVDEMRSSDDPAVRDELNRHFHVGIYRQSDRPRLLAMIEQLRDSASVYLHLLQSAVPAHQGYRSEADDEHQAIIDSLRRGDADAAAAATRNHLVHTYQNIESTINRVGR